MLRHLAYELGNGRALENARREPLEEARRCAAVDALARRLDPVPEAAARIAA